MFNIISRHVHPSWLTQLVWGFSSEILHWLHFRDSALIRSGLSYWLGPGHLLTDYFMIICTYNLIGDLVAFESQRASLQKEFNFPSCKIFIFLLFSVLECFSILLMASLVRVVSGECQAHMVRWHTKHRTGRLRSWRSRRYTVRGC